MDTNIFANTKVAAYFLWEYTNNENAMSLWYCAEDFGYHLETHHILTIEDLQNILKKGHDDFEYIYLVRNLAFRIYIYTNQEDSLTNWFTAEHLLSNEEWCSAMVNLANSYRQNKGNLSNLNSIRLEKIRQYYA